MESTTSVRTTPPSPPPPTASEPVDFDSRPPVPVDEYAHIVGRVNVGYDLFLALSHGFLRSLGRSDLHLLVVGAGGGAEIETFIPSNPSWRMTGVDPSQDMLALARVKAEQLGAQRRVNLVRGTVEDLPADAVFDAATCFLVLHFLSDDDKRALMHGIARRVRPGAPVLVTSGTRVVVDEALRTDVLGTWQQYGELAGMQPERMAATIGQLTQQQALASAESDFVRLFHEVGFAHVAQLLSVFNGGLVTWLLR